jgi:hypothetical protein
MKEILIKILIFLADNFIPLLYGFIGYCKYQDEEMNKSIYWVLTAILWKLLFSL